MIGFGGSKFFIFSMLFDKVLTIFIRYGKFIILTCISLVISSYIYFTITHGTELIKVHNLINRPELVFKYFWSYLKYYYHNRSKLPLSETLKVAGYLVGPYFFLKLILIILNFSKFWIAIKMRNKFPTFSNFLLRRTVLSPQMKDKIIDFSKKTPTSTTIKNVTNLDSQRINSQNSIPKDIKQQTGVIKKRNLRK
jgi:hypothetical protein